MRILFNKLLIAILFFITNHCTKLEAQTPCSDCDQKNIVTDPRPGKTENCENPSKKNKFFWFPYNGTNNNTFNAYYSYPGGNIIGTINNPFWSISPGPIIGTHAGQQYSDFNPEDGWEVIKIDNGYLADNVTQRQTAKSMIYMCFYNKQRGIMRFFGMIPSQTNGWEIIRFKIEILEKKLDYNDYSFTYGNVLQATNLLSIQGDAVQPLDQITDETTLEVVTQFPGGSPSEHFFWFDVPVAYDPCVCKNDIAINLTSQIEQNWDLSIQGVLDGRIFQKTVIDQNSLNQQYEKLVFNRVIGAAAATAVAIVTNGSVIQVSKYIDLIDIIKDKPGVSAQDKTKMNILKDLIGITSSFIYDTDTKSWTNYNTGKNLTNTDWEKLFGGMNKFLSGAYDFTNPATGASITTTTVLGGITAIGNSSQTVPTNAEIYWGLPGSKMSKNLSEEVLAVDENGDSYFDYYSPQYPLYNNPLGTFALIQTPTLKDQIDIVQICDEPDLTTIDPFDAQKTNNTKHTLQLKNDFKYYFNPALNLNLNKTKIKAAYVVLNEHSNRQNQTGVIGPIYNTDNIILSTSNNSLTACGDLIDSELDKITPKNLALNQTRAEYISPFIPLEYFRELSISFVTDKNFSIFKNHIFIRFLIETESNEIGKNGKPIRTTQIFTFPVNLEPHTLPLIDIIDLHVNDDEKNFSQDVNFSNNKDLVYAGLVKINAKLSTVSGIKKRIYSLVGFEILSGGEVSPDIELIVGYPYNGLHPQNQMTHTDVMTFCNNQNPNIEYKAKQFANVPNSNNIHNSLESSSKEGNLKLNFFIMPNPSNNQCTLDLYSTKFGDYSIEINDNQGRLVAKSKISTIEGRGKITIHLENIPAGVYLVSVSNQDDIRTKKLVIQH